MGQSIVLSEIKTGDPLENHDQHIKTLYCSNMKNELISYHNETD